MIKINLVGFCIVCTLSTHAWSGENKTPQEDPLAVWRAEREKYHSNEEIQEPTPYYENILNCSKPMGHHVRIKEFKCPIGNESFESLSLGTHSKFGVYLDWKPVSYMDFPVPLPVCPSNGLVMTKENYTATELKTLSAIIMANDYKEIFENQNSSYYLYAKINEKLQDEAVDQWWLLLNSTWEAYGCKNKSKYTKYALETIQEAEKSLDSLNSTDDNYWLLHIIISNLNRRIGDFETAKTWLNKLEAIPETQEHERLAYTLLKKAIEEKSLEPVQVRKPK